MSQTNGVCDRKYAELREKYGDDADRIQLELSDWIWENFWNIVGTWGGTDDSTEIKDVSNDGLHPSRNDKKT